MSSRSSTTRKKPPPPLDLGSRDSRPETRDPEHETVDVARVRRPHGVRGEVLVDVLSEVPARFRRGARLAARAKDGSRRALTVRASRPHTRGLILSFEELGDRDAAATLAGNALEVSRDEVPPAPEDRWYPFELVGCRCVDRVSGELGEVVDVVEDGGGLLLRVVGGGREILVPFVRALVPVVDVEARRIEVDLPEGFLEVL